MWAVVDVMVGVNSEDLVDTAAAKAQLPPLDSLNCWEMIAGSQEGHLVEEGNAHSVAGLSAQRKNIHSTTGFCRAEIPISDTSSVKPNGDGDTLVGGIIRHDGYKILLGAENKRFLVGQDVLTAPLWPNTTLPPLVPELHPKVCGRSPSTGCLFDILNDPSESTNLAARMPALFHDMLARIDELQVCVCVCV